MYGPSGFPNDGDEAILIGKRNDSPRVRPAMDWERTGSHPSRRVQEALVRCSFAVSAAGRRDHRSGLIIRRSRGSSPPRPTF